MEQGVLCLPEDKIDVENMCVFVCMKYIHIWHFEGLKSSFKIN